MTAGTPASLTRIINQTRGTTVAGRAHRANTFRTRLLGLMGRADLPAGEALIFAPCRGVHTHFMRFPIDLLFVESVGESAGRVVKIRERMGPFRTDLGRSDLLIELPAGTIARTGTAVADELTLLPLEGRRGD